MINNGKICTFYGGSCESAIGNRETFASIADFSPRYVTENAGAYAGVRNDRVGRVAKGRLVIHLTDGQFFPEIGKAGTGYILEKLAEMGHVIKPEVPGYFLHTDI